jgi:hypothetical protein
MINGDLSETNGPELKPVQLRNDYDVNIIQLTPDQAFLCNGEVESQVSEEQARVLGTLMLKPDTWLSAQELLAKNEPPTAMETRHLRSVIRGLAQSSKVLSTHILQGADNKEVQFALVKELEDSKPSNMPKQTPKPRPDYAVMNQDLDSMIRKVSEASPKPRKRTMHDIITAPEPTPPPAPQLPAKRETRKKNQEAVRANADARHLATLAKRAKNNLQFLDRPADNSEGSLLNNKRHIELIITDALYHSLHGLPVDSKSVWNEIIRECSLVTYTEEHFIRDWEAFIDRVPNDELLKNRVTVLYRRNPSTGAKERGVVWMPHKTL